MCRQSSVPLGGMSRGSSLSCLGTHAIHMSGQRATSTCTVILAEVDGKFAHSSLRAR